MEENKEKAQTPEDRHTVPLSRKIGLEILDLLAGTAFPFVVMTVISSTIIMFAGSGDLGISLLALIGGEIMLTAAFVVFGRANGNAAYSKTVLNDQKRALGSKDEKVVCKTGEYALWKGGLIALIVCVPYIIVQIIELCYSNSVCGFCLQYMFGWAYYPFSYLGEEYQALSFIMILLPVAAHMVGYYLGKLKQIKIQEAVAATRENKKGRGK